MNKVFIYDKTTGQNYELECVDCIPSSIYSRPKYLISKENKNNVSFSPPLNEKVIKDNSYSTMFQGCAQISVDDMLKIFSSLREDCTLTSIDNPGDTPFGWDG